MLLNIHTLCIEAETCREAHNLYAQKYVYFKNSTARISPFAK